MKEPEFFLKQAKELLKQFEGIGPYIRYGSMEMFKSESGYNKQQELIQTLAMKTKLLFTEFDNGALFVRQMEAIDGSPEAALFKESWVPSYIEVLKLFIEHIETYRIEPSNFPPLQKLN